MVVFVCLFHQNKGICGILLFVFSFFCLKLVLNVCNNYFVYVLILFSHIQLFHAHACSVHEVNA